MLNIHRSLLISSLSVALIGSVPMMSFAQATAADTKAPTKADEPKRDQKALDYEKATKDLKKYEGDFTVYLRKKDILLEIDESKLDKLFNIQGTMNTGLGTVLQAGDPLGFGSVDTFAFERHDDEVWLVRPNINQRWDKSDPIATAASRSFPRAIINDYKIEQYNPETKKVLINATTIFNGELMQLGMMVSLVGGGAFSLDRDKSGVDHVFAKDGMTVIRMDQHYVNPRGAGMGGEANPLAVLFGIENHLEDPRSAPFKVTYTIWFRDEKSTYMPRVADARVGYFTNDFYSFDRFGKADRTERFINRWNLEKKDPKAKMSEPVKPIVWAIDPSIPPIYRDSVKEGVLRWNKAFEALGYKNAVQVVDVDEKDVNYDHAAGVQNVVRMTATRNSAYAVSLFRTDPISGEILNSGVTIDANFFSFVGREFMESVIPRTSALQNMVKVAKQNTTKIDAETTTAVDLWKNLYQGKSKAVKQAEKMGWHKIDCGIQAYALQDMSSKWTMVQAVGIQMSREDFVKSYIADVVSHEIGHALGLRHNFVSSTTLTTAELCDEKCVHDFGIASSVMDYTPTNIQAILTKNKKILHNGSVGPYDVFAIKYGYSDRMGMTPDSEKFGLSQIARMGGLKGNAFMTDEDADGVDPFVRRFDSAKDPLNYGQKEIDAARLSRKWVLANLPRVGESYLERNSLLLRSFMTQFNNCIDCLNFIGGVQSNRNHKGDVNEKSTLAPVAPAIQRQAMQMIAREGLSMNSIDVPQDVLLGMSGDANNSGATAGTPLRTLLSSVQSVLVAELLSGNRISSILENEFLMKDSSKSYTLREHYGLVLANVFGEVGKTKSIPSIRRECQSVCVEILMAQARHPAGSFPQASRMLAVNALQRLKVRFDGALGDSSVDSGTREHLKSLSMMIERFNNRQVVTVN